MLEEIGADIEFAESWDRFLEELLSEPEMERALLVGDALGMGIEELRSVARLMVDNWDMAAERVPSLDDLPRGAGARVRRSPGTDARVG